MVVKILGHGAFRKRVIEMGFVRGRVVKVLLDAPLRDPVKYELLGYAVSLRRAEADMIEVVKIDNDGSIRPDIPEPSTHTVETHAAEADREGRTINVALIGNPNCGKTSLYNDISGAKEHVGNYGGVTVDIKTAAFDFKGYTIRLTDLPGTYSLAA